MRQHPWKMRACSIQQWLRRLFRIAIVPQLKPAIRYVFLVPCSALLLACVASQGQARVNIGTEISPDTSGRLVFVVDMDSVAQGTVGTNPCQTILSRIDDMGLRVEIARRSSGDWLSCQYGLAFDDLEELRHAYERLGGSVMVRELSVTRDAAMVTTYVHDVDFNSQQFFHDARVPDLLQSRITLSWYLQMPGQILLPVTADQFDRASNRLYWHFGAQDFLPIKGKSRVGPSPTPTSTPTPTPTATSTPTPTPTWTSTPSPTPTATATPTVTPTPTPGWLVTTLREAGDTLDEWWDTSRGFLSKRWWLIPLLLAALVILYWLARNWRQLSLRKEEPKSRRPRRPSRPTMPYPSLPSGRETRTGQAWPNKRQPPRE